MIAILIASTALITALISLVATGTIALRLRMVSPRTDLALGEAAPIPVPLPTRGRAIPDVLGPLIDATIQTAQGQATLRDTFLCEDGCVLFVSTSCAACRYLVHQSRDLLTSGPVRTLVVAPATERGKEFIEKDCRGSGIAYQVDTAGARARALGITEFPSVLIVAGGIVADAYIVGSPGQLRTLSSQPGKRDLRPGRTGRRQRQGHTSPAHPEEGP